MKLNDITAIITSVGEEEKVNKLLDSINKFYPELSCIVGIQSPKDRDCPYGIFHLYDNVEYIHQEYDIGLSKSRNDLINRVKTKYTLVLEDDFVFIESTKIELMKKLLESTEIRVVAGRLFQNKNIRDYQRIIFRRNENIILMDWNRAQNFGFVEYNKIDDIEYGISDIVFNFFLAETEFLRLFGWKDEHKIHSEHLDFMLRLKENNILVSFIPNVIIGHEPFKSEELKPLRYRQYYDLIYKDYGIKKGWCVGEKAMMDYENNKRIDL